MALVKTLSGDDFSPELPHRLLNIAGEIREAGGRAYLVGGWVRDALLGKNCRDYDVEVYDLTQDDLLPILKKYGKTNLVGKAFGVIHLAMRGLSLDFSFPRTESKVGYGHRGFVVHTDEKLSFREAALRRDFTINAMGMELPELALCDPYCGIDDLKKGVLRHVGPAFAEDSLRILRGVQFASRFALSLAPETVQLCRTLSLDDLSIERLFEEFKKWLLKPGKPSLGLRAFLDIGLDGYFPEIAPVCGSWELLGNTLDRMVDAREGRLDGFLLEALPLTEEQLSELAFAALLCGNSLACVDCSALKRTILKFLQRMTNEIHLMRNVPELLSCLGSLDFGQVPAAPELRRMAVKLGGLKLLCLLVQSIPDELVKSRSFVKDFIKASVELDLVESAPQAFLTGKMLLDLGVKPGREMGEIIQRSFELQLDGKIADAPAAISWARETLASR